MKNNIVRVIPNGTHEVTIEYFSNLKRKDIGNQEEFQELSLQYYIDKVSTDNPFCE